MVTNTNVKHNVGGGEYEKRRDRCYAACDKLGVKTLRDVKNLEEIESKPVTNLLTSDILYPHCVLRIKG